MEKTEGEEKEEPNFSIPALRPLGRLPLPPLLLFPVVAVVFARPWAEA